MGELGNKEDLTAPAFRLSEVVCDGEWGQRALIAIVRLRSGGEPMAKRGRSDRPFDADYGRLHGE